MPVPPGHAFSQGTPFQTPFGTPASGGQPTPARMSVIPQARRSVMPRMSTMPSAPNKMLIGGAAAPTVSVSEFQAAKAEAKRLRMQLEQSQEKLEEERLLRQKKEDECIMSFKRLHEVDSKLARYQREHDRHDRRHRRDEDAKAQSENKLKNAINALQSSLDDSKDDKQALAGKLAELSSTFGQKEKELLEVQADLKCREHDNQELLAANDALESRLHTVKTECTDYRKKLDQAEGHAQSLRDTMRDLREEHESHARSLAQEKEALTLEMEEKVDELEDVREQVRIAAAKHDEQVGQLGSENEQLSSEKQRLNSKLQSLQAEGEELMLRWQKQQNEKAEVEKQNQTLQAELASVKKELEKAREHLEHDSAEKANQLSIKNDMLAKLKTDLQAAKQQYVDVQAEKKIKEDDLKEMVCHNATAQSELEDARQEMGVLRKQLEALRLEDSEERKKFASSHNTLQQTTEALKETTRDQKRQLQKVTKQCEMLQREVGELTAAQNELTKENDAQDEKIQDLEYKIQLEEHNAKKQMLIADRMRGKVEQQDADNKKLRKSKKQLVETANERIDHMNAETKRLETLANNYRAEYEMLAARFQRYRERKHNPYYEEAEAEAEAVEEQAAEMDAPDEMMEVEEVAHAHHADPVATPAATPQNPFATPQHPAAAAAPAPRASYASADQDLFDDDPASENLLDPPSSVVAGTPVAPSPVASAVAASILSGQHHFSEADLDQMSYKDVMAVAKALGLKQSGKKKDIIKRVLVAQEGDMH